MQIGGMKGNSSSEHLIVVKIWMKTNKVGETTCIFKAFDMEKFFDEEGLIDTLHKMYTQGKIAKSDYRMWFQLNNKTKNSKLTPLGETDGATIMNGISQGRKNNKQTQLDFPGQYCENELHDGRCKKG